VRADKQFIPEARKIFTISKRVSDRLKKYNGISSKPLYQPPPNHERLFSNDYGNYIFYPSRLSPTKRQHLVIEAMRFVKSNIKLIIAGSADTESFKNKLNSLIHKCDLDQKVELLGMISEQKKVELYANALAVIFTPFEEDYGYVTLEAFYSRKGVITCNDSGGPTEFVHDGQNGLVCNPDPHSIAEAIDHMGENKERTVRYGREGYDFIRGLNLSWDKVIGELVS
jgi:glycosyltransferase involved in cell wall biosynthesis